MSANISAASRMNSQSNQSVRISPSLDRLLNQDEQRLADLLANQKVAAEGSVERDKLNKMMASVERFKARLPASLEALRQLDEADKRDTTGPEGDSKSKDENPRISKSFETKRSEGLAEIEKEVKELKASFEKCKNQVGLFFAAACSLAATYGSFLVYQSLVEVEQPPPVEEPYYGIWNLWGLLS